MSRNSIVGKKSVRKVRLVSADMTHSSAPRGINYTHLQRHMLYLIQRPDQIIAGPDGAARQVPMRYIWSSSVWCTEDGTSRRRYFNPVDGNGSWRWVKESLPLTEDVSGNTGCHLDWFTTVERTSTLA